MNREKLILLAQTLADRIPGASVSLNSAKVINAMYYESVAVTIETPQGIDQYIISFDEQGATYQRVIGGM